MVTVFWDVTPCHVFSQFHIYLPFCARACVLNYVIKSVAIRWVGHADRMKLHLDGKYISNSEEYCF